ncbi:hypothetical protein [Helicobacter macacae]|uniref:Uncharacterized protein n=1 Tax=Helicobacter macacae MIT 99-5501 TaxID=1357400 RepID=V8C8Z2_9HELI|nr:hypothetical protein [Helicobacter macacae]ETD23226.1 hypothetical protein HMPREF2086_01025 [Helicobacter macacae MIT 99-5501]
MKICGLLVFLSMISVFASEFALADNVNSANNINNTTAHNERERERERAGGGGRFLHQK